MRRRGRRLKLPQLLLRQIKPEHLPHSRRKTVAAKKIGQRSQIGLHLHVPGPKIPFELWIFTPPVGVVFRGIRRIGDPRSCGTNERRHSVDNSSHGREDVRFAVIGVGCKIGENHGNRRKVGVLLEHDVAVTLQ